MGEFSLFLILILIVGSNANVVLRFKADSGRFNLTELRDPITDEAFRAQNCYRAKSGVEPLTLDPSISAESQNWANYLARTDSFRHSGGPYGENLYAASPSIRNGGAPIRAWYSEFITNNYNFNVEGPQNSGHFTQLVWKGSSRCGFGLASSSSWTYFVANYDPPGNFLGRFTENVFQPSDRNLDSCVSLSDDEVTDPDHIQIL